MNKSDINVLEFARKISMLSTDTPLADQYDKEHGQKKNKWWSCQREHLTVWCLHYPTGGVKGFLHKPNDSASYMYNHFGRPETLLWLIESLVNEKNIQFTLNDLITKIKETNPKKACKEIRQQVPFEKILEWLQ